MGNDSVVFDRAAAFYDRTRALAPATMDAVVARLARELAGRGPVLEPGVGTGRIALPLAAAGVDVTGLDLSEPMLRELVAKRDGQTRGAGGRVPLVRGDATRLPFPAGAFGGAYVVHLLHLVPGETGGSELYARRLIPALLEVDPSFQLTLFVAPQAAASLAAEPWSKSP